jgi:hypothetical protein
MPSELVATIQLNAADADAILAGNPEVASTLEGLVNTLQANGIVSALPLITPTNTVLLVVSVTGLPGTGINLSDRRATGFRWYAVPIDSPSGTLGTLGSRNTFAASGSGLTAIVVVAYARTDGVDPYEYRVDLPDGAVLSLLQYEFLMNALDGTCPIGVEVNTFRIRRNHVDLDGDGVAEPLLPAASKTFRPFRRWRQRGGIAVDVPDIPAP